MSRHVDFLPLGSVVTLKKFESDVLIVQRCVDVQSSNKKLMHFDYGCVDFPEGMVNEYITYFNQEDIKDVHFFGYDNDRNKELVQIMNKSMGMK